MGSPPPEIPTSAHYTFYCVCVRNRWTGKLLDPCVIFVHVCVSCKHIKFNSYLYWCQKNNGSQTFDLSENNSSHLLFLIIAKILTHSLQQQHFSSQHGGFLFKLRQLLCSCVSSYLCLSFCINNRSITQPGRNSIGLTGSISIYGSLLNNVGHPHYYATA